DNRAFFWSVISAVALFTIVRFELIPISGPVAVFYELCAAIGGGVVLGLMTFAFFRRELAIAVGVIATLVFVPYFLGTLREYIVLLGSLTAYGVSTVVCVALSLRSKERFDFDLLADRVTSFHDEKARMLDAEPRPTPQPARG
ncbi:MAG: sodium:proline symporter, partial [Bordetella trematum]